MPAQDEFGPPFTLEDATLHAAIELGGKSRVVGVKAPGSGKAGLHVLKPSCTPALIALIERHREAASGKSGSPVPVACCHEAGFEGFGPARRLEANGFGTMAPDPSSLLANRKARQARRTALAPGG